jgi:hypothetical protein
MVNITVDPDCGKVTFTSPKLPLTMHARAGKKAAVEFKRFSYEEESV